MVVDDETTGILGVSSRVMAWTPWKVPARTRRSFVLMFLPSGFGEASEGEGKNLWKIREPALEIIRRAKTALGVC